MALRCSTPSGTATTTCLAVNMPLEVVMMTLSLRELSILVTWRQAGRQARAGEHRAGSARLASRRRLCRPALA